MMGNQFQYEIMNIKNQNSEGFPPKFGLHTYDPQTPAIFCTTYHQMRFVTVEDKYEQSNPGAEYQSAL